MVFTGSNPVGYASTQQCCLVYRERVVIMINALNQTMKLSFTQNGAVTYRSSDSDCLDLFFSVGALRNASDEAISKAVVRAYCENPEKTLKIIFYARDIREGLGERRFFRVALHTLGDFAPEAVIRNIRFISEYGRYDDLCALFGTASEKAAFEEVETRLEADISAMENGESVSLLAKWLPSVNASSEITRRYGKRLARHLGMSEKKYRKTLSALRKYLDILENRLRERDYTFKYDEQPSCAMFKYHQAFIRNDNERYNQYISDVSEGRAKINAAALYPYQVVRRALDAELTKDERRALDMTWKNLKDYGGGEENENALVVIDGSGSMYCDGILRPIDAALSLGIYFAERNKGVFADRFITFSQTPQLVKIKGRDIFEKVQYCSSFNEIANTNLEAVFELILDTAVKNKLSQQDMPSRLYIISDMEFDYCVYGGNNMPLFELMEEIYRANGYKLPTVVFWNVNSYGYNVPVTSSKTGVALVSGSSPVLFDMISSGEISAELIMENIIGRERYEKIA